MAARGSQSELAPCATTHGIRVEVRSEYLPEHSDPEGASGQGARFVFGYRIRIANESARTVQLLRRHWVIIDADGERHEVEGEGVVGQQPRLGPGQEFHYHSFCPLPTEWGTMEGTYTFVAADEPASTLQVVIPRFYLHAQER